MPSLADLLRALHDADVEDSARRRSLNESHRRRRQEEQAEQDRRLRRKRQVKIRARRLPKTDLGQMPRITSVTDIDLCHLLGIERRRH